MAARSFFDEPDYMRLSSTRTGICAFDFSKIYPQRDIEGSKQEQDMCYIAECFAAAVQRDNDEEIAKAPSVQDPRYQDSLALPHPSYQPRFNYTPLLHLPHRVPAIVPGRRETLADILSRARGFLSRVTIKSMNDGRFVDVFEIVR